MTNQNEYLKSTKLITAHYGEEYEPDCRQNGSWCDAPGTILNFI